MSTPQVSLRSDGKCRVAVAQVCSTSSKWSNLLNVARCAGWAKSIKSGSDEGESEAQPCQMLFLPECFGFLGSSVEQTLLNAEEESTLTLTRQNPPRITEDLKEMVRSSSNVHVNQIVEYDAEGVTELEDQSLSLLDGLRTIAIESDVWISAGGMHVLAPSIDTEQDPLTRKVYNTHVVLDNHGNVRVDYPKIHLFDVCIPGQVDLRESKSTQPGTKLVVCPDSPIGCLGVTICYDLRFPEMYTELVQTMGAQILLVPSAFTVPTGRAHWHTLLRARAIENQCYVIAAAQYGSHNPKRESYGHSLVVDPWGTIVVDAGGADTLSPVATPSIVTCDIHLDQVAAVRKRMPIQQHRANAKF